MASLISVPFQNNFDFGIGPADGSRWTLNVQPVIPMSISENWNFIGRVILPVVSQSDVFGESGRQTGLGAAVLSGFFSSKEPTEGGLIWGVGPAFLVPTATDDLPGLDKFGLGPNLVGSKVLTMGSQAAQIAVGPGIPYGNGNPADWGFRAVFVLLFPR